jgi:UDPglucose--hexose-1-phosphate uridylyltransferase
MQGGRYSFAMERARSEIALSFRGYTDIEASILDWPMAVIRLTGDDKERLISLADKILVAWRGYSDEAAGILAKSGEEPHNTITPIARRRGERYELDLVLRNNRTSDEHPLGIFHPHAERHHIKRENIGLIEVMGLAVLPARLLGELDEIAALLLDGGEIKDDSHLAPHAAWVESLRERYTFTRENVSEILYREVGEIFTAVLEDASVYKCTPDGRAAFLRFVDFVNS